MEVESNPLLAEADYAALQRVLDNLVGNALKFTQEGGSVCVRAHQHADTVALIIEDTGPGIGENMLGHLFEPFVQSPDESAGTAKGSGLGLAITRRLVTAMRGSIDLDQSYTDGARFRIELPIPKTAQRPAGNPGQRTANSGDITSRNAQPTPEEASSGMSSKTVNENGSTERSEKETSEEESSTEESSS